MRLRRDRNLIFSSFSGDEEEDGRPLLAVVQSTYMQGKRALLAVSWMYRQEDVVVDGGELPPDCRPQEVTTICAAGMNLTESEGLRKGFASCRPHQSACQHWFRYTST